MDIKETKEAIIALTLLGKFVADRAKDGLQLDDAVALAAKLASDPDFLAKVKLGIDGAEKIPAEIKDMSFAEVLELAGLIPEMLTILKAA